VQSFRASKGAARKRKFQLQGLCIASVRMASMSDDRVIPTGKARSVVRSFLSKLGGEEDAESSSENENLSVRPARLGVGAKAEHRNVPGTGRIDQR